MGTPTTTEKITERVVRMPYRHRRSIYTRREPRADARQLLLPLKPMRLSLLISHYCPWYRSLTLIGHIVDRHWILYAGKLWKICLELEELQRCYKAGGLKPRPIKIDTVGLMELYYYHPPKILINSLLPQNIPK
jgi:hypothetical protein